MYLIDLNGRKKKFPRPEKYLVDWDDKSRSQFQKNVKNILYEFWVTDVVFEEFPVLGTRLRIDFFNFTQRIALEVDGKQHYSYNRFFHGGSRAKFLEQIKRDEKKDIFCVENEIKMVRICEDEDLTRELVIKKIDE